MLDLRKFEITKPSIIVFVIGSDKDAYIPTDSLDTTANFYDTRPMILRGLCHDMMLDPVTKYSSTYSRNIPLDSPSHSQMKQT